MVPTLLLLRDDYSGLGCLVLAIELINYEGLNPFTSDFTVTVSDINGLFIYFFLSIKFIVKLLFV